jgi:O-antigen ligase
VLRLSLLTLFITFLCLYSFKDWFKALCGLVLLMAVVEHPDMPKSLLGIQGLNPWNITLVFVCVGYLLAAKKEKLKWDLPPLLTWLLVVYFLLIFIGFFRLTSDDVNFQAWANLQYGKDESNLAMISEFLINCMKWVVPGFLMFQGCRDRVRLKWAVTAIVLVYFLLALQVIRWMPLSNITSGGEALKERSLKILVNEVGFHRVNLAMMLSGAFWALFSCSMLLAKQHKIYIYAGCVVVLIGLALTGGRTGYATWAAIGGVLVLLRWRKLIVLSPFPVIAVLVFFPGVADRLGAGFGGKDIDSNVALVQAEPVNEGQPHWYTVTAGRSVAWPRVLEKISEAPWVGYGREAMIATGTSMYLIRELGESFPHPHNAYLQWILDNGFLGAVPVFLFYFLMLKYSISSFLRKDNMTHAAIGGVATSLLLALLIAGFGSQSFYPREGAVGMWCALGLLMRLRLGYFEEHVLTNASEDEADTRNIESTPMWLKWSSRGNF